MSDFVMERLAEPIQLDDLRAVRLTRETWDGQDRLHVRILREGQPTTAGLNLPPDVWRLILAPLSVALREDRPRRWARTASEVRRLERMGLNASEISQALGLSRTQVRRHLAAQAQNGAGSTVHTETASAGPRLHLRRA